MAILDDREFVRENIFPVGIVCTRGEVTGLEALTVERPLQITISEGECARLRGSGAYIVLDFGRELHGGLRLLTYLVSGGTRLRIVYGESVAEALSEIGERNATNDHALRDFVTKPRNYSDMSFSKSGFRFAKLELIGDGEIYIKSAVAVAEYRDIPYLGSFECDREALNEIYRVAAYTCHVNMQNYIWDGIKRDRLVWVGDMHPEMLTVRTVFGAHSIIPRSVAFAREGHPLPAWMNTMPTYSLWWLIIVRDWYFYSGDRLFLRENKGYVTELSKIICGLVNDDGSDSLPSYFLDWPCHGRPEEASGARAVLALALEAAAELAGYYGKVELEALCRDRKLRLTKRKAETYGAKQVAAMLALAGQLDPAEAGAEILRGGARGWSTFMSYYLLKVASGVDMAATLAGLEEYYGGMLRMGATSFWEDFDLAWLEGATPIDEPVPEGAVDIHGDHGAFCYEGFRHSLCHGWSSAPTAFLAEEVLGIKLLEPGCRRVAIRPCLGGLKFARGSYPTPLGVITVEHRQAGEDIVTEYSAPDGIEIVM